jgi:alpha-tubulin suppressor-like RCC1 family protein
MKLSLRTALGGSVLVGVALGLFACATSIDRGQPDVPGAEASVTQPDADRTLDAGTIRDARDELVLPDGAVECDAAPCAVALTGAGNTFCARLQTGAVACWGNNDQGQLGYDSGTGFPPASAVARLVEGLAAATSVSAGDGNTCASVLDGGVFCWGAPELVGAGVTPKDGGAPYDSPVTKPRRVDAVPPATRVAVGTQVACATSATGALSCWGHNESLELGRGPTAAAFAPPASVALAGQGVVVARPGVNRTFVVTQTGSLWSWGASTQQGTYAFLLGRDTSEDPDGQPDTLVLPPSARAVATGPAHACAIVGRDVMCWGSNESGQLGRGSFGPLAFLPASANLGYVVAAEDADAGLTQSVDVPLDVSAGDDHTCVAMGSGRVYCWGANAQGQLGTSVDESIARTGVPQRIQGLSGPAVAVASGRANVCVLLRSGIVECWGPNYAGQLGLGSIDEQSHRQPKPVSFPR